MSYFQVLTIHFGLIFPALQHSHLVRTNGSHRMFQLQLPTDPQIIAFNLYFDKKKKIIRNIDFYSFGNGTPSKQKFNYVIVLTATDSDAFS